METKVRKGLPKFMTLNHPVKHLVIRTQHPFYIFELHSTSEDAVNIKLRNGSYFLSVAKDFNNVGLPPKSYYEEVVRWYYYNFLPNEDNQTDFTDYATFPEELIHGDLTPLFEFINGAYVAEHCFDKSRQWLYQRVNENIVNGKPAEFTIDQKHLLSTFLKQKAKELEQIAYFLEQ